MKVVNNKGRGWGEKNDSKNGSERGREEADARNKGEESCPGPGGKNIRQGYYHRTELGYRTNITAWGRRKMLLIMHREFFSVVKRSL